MADTFNNFRREFQTSDLVGVARKNDFGTNFLTPFLLFVLLAPGLILSIPSTVKANEDPEAADAKKTYFMSGRVDWASALVHALVFTVLLYVLKTMVFPRVLSILDAKPASQ
jgi:hypothetical protein